MSDPDAEASVGAKTEEEQERPEAIDEADTDGLVDDNVNLEPDEEYSPAISALPPRIVKQEENQVEVSASPAFQCLDEVSNFYVRPILDHRLKEKFLKS